MPIIHLKNSIRVLDEYKTTLIDFSKKEQSIEALKEAMDSYFRALFLDVYSMMEIIGEKELILEIGQIRKDFLAAMKLNIPLMFSNYISIKQLKSIIDRYYICSTVELSIKYICNPDKTDSQILISSHGCGHKTADLDFKETWKRWNSASKIQARHLIQSFSPEDEVTPEQAHDIGKELMNKVLKGEYEYVMTTHVDKNHIHNHFVFNNVNSKTGKLISRIKEPIIIFEI